MAQLTINGESRTIDVPGDTTLLWALRDLAGLKGTKYGCGVGLCGACTIHVDGVAQVSCMLTVSQVEGTEITTIEGLSDDGNHPVQVAWRELNVPQCGFCQAGQIMTAASLIEDKPDISDQEILDGMSGNLCRCGCYQRIVAAVRTAATGS
ncbi:MAG: (2Fe-2S)-binding protein [Rhodobacteraceae bacterium]|nr:(2Fe-2S)-binding protein [Paracoccaceae bacterium]